MIFEGKDTKPKIFKENFHNVEVLNDSNNSHKLTYKLGEKERLRIFANLLIDKFLEINKQEQTKVIA